MRILSGIKPTGKLHIGNYFGAFKQFLEYDDAFIFVANYHALNTHPEPEKLKEMTLDIVLDYLALGLDPNKATIFLQSDVPEVTELTFILSNYTPMGLLERAHAYKDAIAKGKKDINHGLFTYPVLMAADILLYQSELVPVGKDQKQHLEIARDLAIKFNGKFGEVFTVPEPKILENVAVVPGLDGRKMSKSYDNTIEVFLEPKKLKKKIMKIVTDSTPVEEPKDPDKCNVFNLYKLFATKEEIEEMREKYRLGNYGYGHAKLELFEKINNFFAPYREKRKELEKNQDDIFALLQEHAQRARKVAKETIEKVRDAVGILKTRR